MKTCGPDSAPSSCSASDAHDCVLACADVCALHPGEPIAPIDFAEARARFEREAIHGVCHTGRYRMPYYVWGDGPPLLFVHGLGDSGHSFLQPISRLSAHFRCIAYEQPSGWGDGARLRRYGHDHLAADVWSLLDHLGLRQSYILGSSFGATIVLKAMHGRPERFPRGILQGGLAYRPLRRAERFLSFWGRFLPGRMAGVPLREKVLLKTAGSAFKEAFPDIWAYFLECSGRARLAAVAGQAHLLHRIDLRPILSAIRQPMLLICGDCDRVVPRPHEEMLLQGLPNAGRVVIEGCGHVPSYTHPEVLAQVVRQFLTPPSPEKTEPRT
ncbi:MAG: alpha/beta fold hydrolase [Gemmataceae bacterium]